jgi:hypothetical protein
LAPLAGEGFSWFLSRSRERAWGEGQVGVRAEGEPKNKKPPAPRPTALCFFTRFASGAALAATDQKS